MKLYDDLIADFELQIVVKEENLLFLDAFSDKHKNMLMQQKRVT